MQIAITGIGLIHADHVGRPTILPTTHTEWPIGEVPYTDGELKHRLGIDPNTTLSRNTLLAMVAMEDTLRDAGLSADLLASTPLINGTTVGGMDLTEAHFGDWTQGQFDQIDLIRQHEADETTRALCAHFGLGAHLTTSTACSSALNAMIHGAAQLRLGEVDRVVVGGTEAMTRFHLNGFASLGILSHKTCRPFQDDRDGINLGEGAAYLVLENAEAARLRGAKIYGYLAGYANRCDAYHQTASSPEGDGAYDAMRAALTMAGLRPNQIPYINAHGTATPNNDASELCAIRRLFGEHMPVVESTKPRTGHTTSASGSIEAIFTLRTMQEQGYPYAMSNAFGFGGNDSSIVLSAEPVSLPDVPAEAICRSTSCYASTGELDYKPYLPVMQARRMTPMMRQLVAVARQALEEAGIDCPDGIVVGTQWGGIVPSMQLLRQLTESGEDALSPAQFMLSTHNGAAGTLARLLGCRGYNMTVVASDHVLESAAEDARLMMRTGEVRSVLVCSFDECDEGWDALLRHVDLQDNNLVQATVLWYD